MRLFTRQEYLHALGGLILLPRFFELPLALATGLSDNRYERTPTARFIREARQGDCMAYGGLPDR